MKVLLISANAFDHPYPVYPLGASVVDAADHLKPPPAKSTN